MPGLRDIGLRTKDVVIGGETFAVRGFSIDTLADVLARSAELEKMMAGGVKFDARAVIAIVPQTARELTALALGAESDEERAGVARLTAGEQLEVLEAAWEVTFPNGAGRLGEWVGRLLAGGASGNGQDTTSSPRLMN